MGFVDKIRDTAEEIKDKAESVLTRDQKDDAADPAAPVEVPEAGHEAYEDAPPAPSEPAPAAARADAGWPKLAIRSEGSVRLPGLAFDVPEGTKLPGVPIGSQWPTNEKRAAQVEQNVRETGPGNTPGVDLPAERNP